MKTQKKEWKTPELIVIARSNPEEAVLTTCKGDRTTVAPGTDARGNCVNRRVDCSTVANSQADVDQVIGTLLVTIRYFSEPIRPNLEYILR